MAPCLLQSFNFTAVLYRDAVITSDLQMGAVKQHRDVLTYLGPMASSEGVGV